MSALARELVAELAHAIRDDPGLGVELAQALEPYLPERGGGWLSAQDAARYLGLGSLDALDRTVAVGLPYAQPGGPGGRRYFERAALEAWMRDAQA